MATKTITDETLETVLKETEIPVIIDFWAECCGPCKQMVPHLEVVSENLTGKVKILKINVDEKPMAASKIGVRGLPTLMLFKVGSIAEPQVGAMSVARISERFGQHIWDKTFLPY